MHDINSLSMIGREHQRVCADRNHLLILRFDDSLRSEGSVRYWWYNWRGITSLITWAIGARSIFRTC